MSELPVEQKYAFISCNLMCKKAPQTIDVVKYAAEKEIKPFVIRYGYTLNQKNIEAVAVVLAKYVLPLQAFIDSVSPWSAETQQNLDELLSMVL